MKKNFAILEVGRSYRDRKGWVVTITSDEGGGRFPYIGDSGLTYVAAGTEYSICECDRDLIELIEEPKMNRLKGLKLKFDVKGNPELLEAIVARMVELGAIDGRIRGDSSNWPFVILTNSRVQRAYDSYSAIDNYKLTTLDDLYHLKPNTIITLADDREIELSQESYEKLAGEAK